MFIYLAIYLSCFFCCCEGWFFYVLFVVIGVGVLGMSVLYACWIC